jgi:hypothetical protein
MKEAILKLKKYVSVLADFLNKLSVLIKGTVSRDGG